MSLGHGSSITRDGLVFSYDMNNVKSFKGRPTSNLAYVNGYATQASVVSSVPDEQNLRKLSGAPVTDRVAILNNTASNFLDFYRVDGIVLDPGDAVVVSYYVYPLSTPNLFNTNGNFGTELGTNAGIGGATNLPPNQWSRIVVSKTNTTASQITVNTLRVEPYTPAEWGGETNCYAANPQFEVVPSGQTVFASPFVSGTRASTESLVDLQRQNTLTSLDLVYNSDNTFEFDGSTSYIQSNNARSALGIADTYSVEVVFKRTAIDAGRIIIGGQGFNWGLLTTTNGFRANNWYSNDSGSSWNIIATAEYSLPINTWVHAVGTFNHLGNMTLYANGNLISTADMSARTNYWRDSTICVGGWTFAGYRVNAQIPIARFYGKELTADEVSDNFEAIRGRFGI